MAHLRRISDGAGDSGARVEAIQWKPDGTKDKIVGSYPVVGCSLLVGSVTAGTFSDKDWWCTTIVTEILEEREGYVRFLTESGSIYELTE